MQHAHASLLLRRASAEGRISPDWSSAVGVAHVDGFEWDPDKEKKNILKHKVDFATASRIWEGFVFEQNDDRRDYGEPRLQALGEVDDRLMVVVITWRGTVRRIISARKANPREKRRFEAEVHRRRTKAEG